MDFFIRFAYPLVAYVAVIITCVFAYVVYKRQQQRVYVYPLVSTLSQTPAVSKHPYRSVLWLTRLVILIFLSLLLAKPQQVDVNSKVRIEGIDIMLVLDVSGSMEQQDSQDDSRRRIDIAKEEAIRFIDKRHNDALGLVLFGRLAVARCPLTVDKKMLKKLVNDIELGFIDHQGTVIAKSLIAAANRLKNSTATSKIIILLTDGAPTPEDDNPELAINVLKELGIKVYTIGIGNEKGGQMIHPFYGVPIQIPPVDMTLIERIAQETGGQFFRAAKAQDMHDIYNAIDKLEKTVQETNVYHNYYDIFEPFIWLLFAIIFFELLVTTWWWFSIW